MFGPGESSVVIECAGQSTCTVIHSILTSLILFSVLIVGFAYTTVLERRFLAFLQARVGPNRTGPYGLLQPVADGVKLIFKEDITPARAEKIVFWAAPVIKTVPALIVLAVVPFGPKIAVPWFDGKWYRLSQGLIDVNVGVLWLLGITSIGIYGVVLAGWSSNNKYAMLGGLRSSAQMVSYELSMGLAMVVPVMLAGSMSVGDIIDAQNDAPILGWFVFQNPMAAAIMAIALLAEVNRAPFDMPEAEQELTAGYHFAYVDQAPLLGPVVFGLKVVALLVVMIWVRGTLPRIRYDRLMAFGWKVMLPFALVAVAWSAVAVVLDEEVGGPAKLIMAVIAWGLFLAGASFWLGRVGRKSEPASAARVEVVSLSGGSGRMLGVPSALARAVSGRGGSAESEQPRSGGKRPG